MNNEIEKIDKWFRLANYISAAQMYLDSNFFLDEELKKEQLKKYVAGHWGVSSAVNFVYAHIHSYAKRKNKQFQIIVGEGHAGSAVISNLFIQKTISKYYDKYPYNIQGLSKLIKEFGTSEGFRTEINPEYPETIYDGGELGYSHVVAYGASLKNKNILFPCIIGDGEAETGTICASWNIDKILNDNNNYNVLPILNLNGYKMGSKSIFSQFSDEQLKQYFSSMGYVVYIVNASHEEMYNALESLEENKKNIIILKSKKGWTAPDDVDIKIEGTKISHKNPLAKIKDENIKIEYLKKWLSSYNVKELINRENKDNNDDKNNLFDSEIIDIISTDNNRYNFENKNTNKNIQNEELSLEKYNIDEKEFSNIRGITNYLKDRINEDNNFMIFSPDELESNFLGDLLEDENTKNNVVEILNENICQGLLQGHIQAGNKGIIVSYEAFMPIVTSMLSQYEKYLYQSSKYNFRKPLNSFTYILTSVCWENNYSHQNPEFLSCALNKEYDFVNVYTPMDANSLIVTLDKCLNEKNSINIIDISKRKKKQYTTIKEAQKNIENGIEVFAKSNKEKTDVILVAIGDYILEQMIEAKEILEQNNIGTKILYVTKLNALKNLKKDTEISEMFGKDELIFVGTHTYASTIKNLLFDIKDRKICINGFEDKSDIAGPYTVKLEKNNLSSNIIIDKIENLLKE